jgi:peptide/nickel transport system permease protein
MTEPIALSETRNLHREPTDAQAPPVASERPGRRRRLGLVKIIALFWVVLIVGAALLAPLLPLHPDSGGLGVAARPFGGNGLLGTDELGRDELSRLIYGARISLLIACVSVGIALVVGVTLGLSAGYFRGKFDACINAVIDVILAFPGIVLLTVVVALIGPSLRDLIAAIAFITIPPFMRLARANTMVYAEREFVRAARGLGARGVRIALREILPNILPALSAYAFAQIGLVFVLEGSLDFLGLGVQPPTPSWGDMIASGRTLITSAPQLVVIPGITLFLTVLAFNALSDGWGDAGRSRKFG